jgi:hypothetical protein
MNVVLTVYSLARFAWGEKSATFTMIIRVVLVVPKCAIIYSDVRV